MTLMKLERVCLSSPQALPADDDGMPAATRAYDRARCRHGQLLYGSTRPE
jgi:hypothetical protein